MNGKNTKDFTIGADPEFVCTDKYDAIICAEEVVGGDEDSDFGADGNGTTFEIRPEPSKDPIQVVNNIRDIFVRQMLNTPKILTYEWHSGSFYGGYPIGGHVHFGITSKQINHNTAISFLDNYVGAISLLLEKRDDGVLRRKKEYGFMGDWRDQKWGFEYRPMSSWISTPYISSAILCLSKTVMFEVLNNPKFIWHNFVVADDFIHVRQDNLLKSFPQMWNDITNMKMYQVYKPYIDLIYFLITNRLTWFGTSGMKESWGIMDMTQCFSNKIGIDVIWNRYNQE